MIDAEEVLMVRLRCGHREYARGHCAKMSCDNYAAKHGWPWDLTPGVNFIGELPEKPIYPEDT